MSGRKVVIVTLLDREYKMPPKRKPRSRRGRSTSAPKHSNKVSQSENHPIRRNTTQGTLSDAEVVSNESLKQKCSFDNIQSLAQITQDSCNSQKTSLELYKNYEAYSALRSVLEIAILTLLEKPGVGT